MKEVVSFKGKDYPIRTLTMREGKGIYTRIIADQTLFDAISVDDKYLDMDTPEYGIDTQIYFYVEEGQLELEGKVICEDLLDEPFEFVCEGEYEQ